MRKLKVGFVGVGCISDIYLKNITGLYKDIEVIGVCDLIRERAEAGAAKYGVPKVYKDMYELFADPEVDIVLNITRPYEHYAVTKAALLAGKHVYSEKPLSPNLAEARELVALAAEKNLRLGGAPDTFLGAGIQTCRKLIDDGFIGTPIGATARMATHGPESWHPDPESFYLYGAGPMFDMGPYYMTALVNLLGRATRVTGMARASMSRRVATCSNKYGKILPVEVPTFYSGTIQFESGVLAQIMTTFDVYTDNYASIEIFGTEGTLLVPDPNTFGGPVRLMRPGMDGYETIPLLFHYDQNSRALGLDDMAAAIRDGRDHRACAMQQLHVVELLNAIETSMKTEGFVTIESPFTRKPPMDFSKLPGVL